MRASELLNEGNIKRLHPINPDQMQGTARAGHVGVRNRSNDDLFKFGASEGTDPITVNRVHTLTDDPLIPGSRLEIQAGHNRLEEIRRRVQNGTVSPDTIFRGCAATMTLRFTQTEGRWNFKSCDWSEDESSWFLLYLVNGEDALHAWSSEQATAEAREQLLSDVAKSSNDVENKYDLIDAFMDQSREWSFWGSGIHAPIADYYDSVFKNELRKQLHS